MHKTSACAQAKTTETQPNAARRHYTVKVSNAKQTHQLGEEHFWLSFLQSTTGRPSPGAGLRRRNHLHYLHRPQGHSRCHRRVRFHQRRRRHGGDVTAAWPPSSLFDSLRPVFCVRLRVYLASGFKIRLNSVPRLQDGDTAPASASRSLSSGAVGPRDLIDRW